MTQWKRIPLFAALIAAAAVVAAPRLEAQVGKIAVINTEQIIAQSAAGLAAEAQFTAWVTPLQQELTAMQTEITTKGQELEAQQRALSPEALRQRQQELERLDRELTRKTEDFQADFTARQQELLEPVLLLADQALQALSAEQNYTMVWDVATLNQYAPGALVYLSPTVDLSTEVIRRMDDLTASGESIEGESSGLALPASEEETAPDPAPAAPASTQ